MSKNLPQRASSTGKTRRGRPSQISRDAILDAAERHAEGDWTVATIATDLGVSVAAIYHYFAGRDALFAALGQRVLASSQMPPLEGDWRTWLRALGRFHYEVAVRHPFMTDSEGFLQAFAGAGAEELERPLAALEAAGIAPDDCITAYWLVGTTAMEHARARVMWDRHQAELAQHVEMLNQRAHWFTGKIDLASKMNPAAIETLLERALDMVIAGIEQTAARASRQ